MTEKSLPEFVKGHFLQISFSFESKPKRYFLFFKPNEIIVDENFKVTAHLKNFGKEEFPGGSLSYRNEYTEETSALKTKTYKGLAIPKIAPNKKVDVTTPLMKSQHAGTNYLQILIFADDGKTITCFPPDGGFAYDLRQERFPFHVTTKEELYQYYGVWFAVVLSLIAIALSIANGIIAILQFLKIS